MRTEEEILQEIDKVEKAKYQAKRKIVRCDDRLAELDKELLTAESDES